MDLATLALVWLIGLLWLVWLAFTAPEGFEDEHGFHFGPEA